jgi:putative PIN family toxin of toxin-antitoxin system
MRSKKIILDTNLWISFLISKRLEEIDNLLLDGSIKLIFSNESVEELFGEYLEYLRENQYKVIAVRDLEYYIDVPEAMMEIVGEM